MGKILKAIAVAALFIGAAIVTGGISLVPTAVAGSATVAGVTVATVTLGSALATTALGSALLIAGASTLLSGIASAFVKTPSIPLSTLNRFQAGLDPSCPRKMVFGGLTGFPADIRYSEPFGTDDDTVDYIICVASHRVHSIKELYLGSDQVWTLAGGVLGKYVGYLTVTPILEGTAGNAMGAGVLGLWSTNARLTGCAYLKLRVKRTGIGKKDRSPLEGGLPGLVRIIGEGMPVYDPRRDSTRGGSGSHRANDNSTWQFFDGATNLGSNPYLQSVSALIGWYKNGQRMVGAGYPLEDIDFASVMAAANLADESISLTGGGTQRRYETHGVFSDAQAWRDVADSLMACSGGEVDDSTGRLAFRCRHNDLASVAMALNEDDLMAGWGWDPTPEMRETFNVVRGRFSDPAARYDLNEYKLVEITSPDGVTRTRTIDFGLVQDGKRAQRLARAFLQSAQYRGIFTCVFSHRALALRKGNIVTLTGPLGFSGKLFRVLSQTLTFGSGLVEMVLGEEDAAIYAGDGTEEAAVVVPSPVLYDPRNQPSVPLDYEYVLGVTRPENNATRGDNLQPNGDLATDTAGYNLAGAWQRVAAPADWPVDFVLQNTVTAMSGGSYLIAPRSPVKGGDLTWCQIRVERSAALSGLQFVLNEFEDPVTGGGLGPVAGTTVTAIPSAIDSVEAFEISGRTSAFARGVEIWVDGLAGATIGAVRVGAFRVAGSEQGADITTQLIVPSDQVLQADYTGAFITSPVQLPRTLKATVLRSGKDVTTEAILVLNVGSDVATIDRDGVITLKQQPRVGTVQVAGILYGKALTPGVFNVRTDIPAAPVGGGGTAGRTASTSTFIASAASTSFVPVIAALRVGTGSAGSVSCVAPLQFYGDGTTGLGVLGKWRYRLASGGSWTDVGSAISASYATSTETYEFIGTIPTPGYITVNQTASGLTASTDYDFELIAATPSGTIARNFYGNCSVTGS